MPALRSTEPRFRRGCPPEVDDRVMPGHWEGDFIKGAGNKSSVGVLVERSSRLVLLARMEDAIAAAALKLRSALKCLDRRYGFMSCLTEGLILRRRAGLCVRDRLPVIDPVRPTPPFAVLQDVDRDLVPAVFKALFLHVTPPAMGCQYVVKLLLAHDAACPRNRTSWPSRSL
jgi:hypothetical protein